jgi:hypothetical protein
LDFFSETGVTGATTVATATTTSASSAFFFFFFFFSSAADPFSTASSLAGVPLATGVPFVSECFFFFFLSFFSPFAPSTHQHHINAITQHNQKNINT